MLHQKLYNLLNFLYPSFSFKEFKLSYNQLLREEGAVYFLNKELIFMYSFLSFLFLFIFHLFIF